MKPPRWIALIGFAFLIPRIASAAGLPPWQFGMTEEQVASFKEFGPYKSFQGRDLETYNRQYHGRKENVQFYFVNHRLIKIAIDLGERLDKQSALAVFKRAVAILEKDYGKLESPEIRVPPSGGRFDADVLAATAVTNATMQGKTHMGPVKMPKGMSVWVTVMNVPNLGGLAVTIFLEPR